MRAIRLIPTSVFNFIPSFIITNRAPTPARDNHAALVNESTSPTAIMTVAIARKSLVKVGLSFFIKRAIDGGIIIANTAP